jgi:hypothetical protein
MDFGPAAGGAGDGLFETTPGVMESGGYGVPVPVAYRGDAAAFRACAAGRRPDWRRSGHDDDVVDDAVHLRVRFSLILWSSCVRAC